MGRVVSDEAAAEESAGSRGRRVVGGRDLPAAIGVGIALATVFLGSLFWRPEAFVAVLVVVAWLAVVETARVLRRIGVRLLVGPLLLGTTCTIVLAAWQGAIGQAIGVAVLFGSAVLRLLVMRERPSVLGALGATTFFGLWVGLLASYASLLVTRADGAVAVLAVIGGAIMSDIGGYVVGVALGRRRIAPRISPNKTWEGLLGGLFLAGIAGALVLPWLGSTFSTLGGASFAIVCGLAGFVGDLVESMVKRDLGIKDLGGILPGHGGMLDRVDGILFALPVGAAVLALAT